MTHNNPIQNLMRAKPDNVAVLRRIKHNVVVKQSVAAPQYVIIEQTINNETDAVLITIGELDGLIDVLQEFKARLILSRINRGFDKLIFKGVLEAHHEDARISHTSRSVHEVPGRGDTRERQTDVENVIGCDWVGFEIFNAWIHEYKEGDIQ